MSTPLTDHSPAMHDSITSDFVAQYRKNGFAILRNALSTTEVTAINEEALRICRDGFGDSPEIRGVSDAEMLRKFLCIHYPHKLSDLALAAMKHPTIVKALEGVIGPNVKAMQSMLFIKSEGKPGQAWHQDEHFIPTRDRSLTAAWIALDDATVENGCLWVLPGSHQRGVLYPDRKQDDPRFDCSTEAFDFPYSDNDAIPVQIPAGAALIFNGYLLHRSLENSGKHGYRRALVNHYMSAESLLPWKKPQGEYFGEYDYRDIVLVAGDDPYAHKGLVDESKAYSRAEKDGGCDR
ncbi:phytanoyl-CoA dioxygenase family protein [Pseudarthrobacter sp. SSS035]|uniref:phytanoyl-CoA dioxygenase family protein n=1 Tax=Pseudarthrobacter sp. SSS035 TaxID=2931399 RepID=UPI00200C5F8C|nr:phytanoyl-CoA dioxygenase family protein [Pseudarthrobacter sp. SSS035]